MRCCTLRASTTVMQQQPIALRFDSGNAFPLLCSRFEGPIIVVQSTCSSNDNCNPQIDSHGMLAFGGLWLWPAFDKAVTLARMLRKLTSVLLFVACAVAFAGARVVRVEVTSRNDVLGGKSFGDAGPYERILGRVYYAVPVTNPHNQHIVDLDKAVNLKNGEVEFSAEFVVVRPKDPKRGNGSLLLEIP